MCDCLDLTDAAFEKRGDPTRVDAVLYLDGRAPGAEVRTHVDPDDPAGRRRGRHRKAVRLAAAFCPFCGEKYPEPMP